MFKLSTGDRLSRWKAFRATLDRMSSEQAISQTQDFWNNCPFHPFYLDIHQPGTWPDPWQLIQDNYYCDLAKCLGIVYTLHLSMHSGSMNPQIRIYFDNKTGCQWPIVYLCQGKYVLNLIEGEIVNKEHISQKLNLVRCYTAADLRLEQY
jgi:hypothetical protein